MHSFRTEGKGGGVAIYVKNSIDYETIKFNKIDIGEIEAVGIKFKSKNANQYITLLSVYLPLLNIWIN